MFCSSCGKEIPDTAKFCPICGTNFAAAEQPAAQPVAPAPASVPTPAPAPAEPVQAAPTAQPVQPAQTAQPAPEFIPQYAPQAEAAAPAAAPAASKFDINALLKNKKVLIGAAAAVAVIVLIIIIAALASAGGGSSAYNIVTTGYNYYSEDDNIHLFYGATQLEPIEAEGISSSENSLDGSAMYLYTYDSELFYIKGTKIEEVGEVEHLQMARLSEDGSTLAYVYYDDGEYVFETYKNGSVSEIYKYENSYTYDSFTMSPDGSVIMYTVYEDGDNVLYAYNGEEIEIGKDLSVVKVSNGGKVAYVYDNDKDKLCYIKNLDNGTKETIDDEYGRIVASTTSGDAILYRNDEGHTYMYNTSLKEPVLVEKNSISLVFPATAINKLDSFDNFLASEDGTIRRYQLKGKEYKDENKVLSASKYSMYMLSADGSTIVYSDGDELCKISTKPDSKETVIYDDMGSYFFYADPTLSHIYFLDGDDQMCHSNGSKGNCKPIIDEDQAEEISDAQVTAAGIMVLLDEDDTLFYIDGTSVKEVKKPSEVDSIDEVVGNTVFVSADDEIWVSKDGKTYTNTKIED